MEFNTCPTFHNYVERATHVRSFCGSFQGPHWLPWIIFYPSRNDEESHKATSLKFENGLVISFHVLYWMLSLINLVKGAQKICWFLCRDCVSKMYDCHNVRSYASFQCRHSKWWISYFVHYVVFLLPVPDEVLSHLGRVNNLRSDILQNVCTSWFQLFVRLALQYLLIILNGRDMTVGFAVTWAFRMDRSIYFL